MDNSGTLPPLAALHPTMRRHLVVGGLAGVSVADIYGGGMPENIRTFSSPGDRWPDTDIPNPITPNHARGEGPNYQPHPYLPSAQHLDYLHKFSSASLLTIGLLLLVGLFVIHPRRAGGLIARGGLKQAGIA